MQSPFKPLLQIEEINHPKIQITKFQFSTAESLLSCHQTPLTYTLMSCWREIFYVLWSLLHFKDQSRMAHL